jgi:hypothetical protein
MSHKPILMMASYSCLDAGASLFNSTTTSTYHQL